MSDSPPPADRIEQLACRALLKNIQDGVFTLDRAGRFTFVNDFIAQSSGFPPEAFLGQSYLDFIRPEDRERVRQNFEETLAGGCVLPYELIYNTANRGDMWVEVNTAPLVDDGRTIGVLGLSRNVQRRRQVELSLRESEEKYRRLVEELPSGVAIIQDDRFVFTNETLRRLLRIGSEEQAAQANVFAFIDDEHREQLRERMYRRLAGEGTEPTRYTARLRRADGEAFEVELHVRRVQQLGRNALQCVVIDISDRLRLEEQLRHTQKMEAVGALAGGIAHDFNNLLTAILGMSGVLRQRSGMADIADVIEKAASQAATLTSQLQRFAHRDADTSGPVDVHAIIRDVVDILSCSVDRSVEFEIQPRALCATVQGDAAQLHQVVLNLAVNARDAMPQGGRVVIETRNSEAENGHDSGATPRLEVAVSDSGPGIPPVIADRIFEPFFSTKPTGKGSGMGLAMVYGIVRRHHGMVRFECPPSGGTTFLVHLPTADAGIEVEPPATPPRHETTGRGTLLFVDDEEVVREVAGRMLGQLGYDVLLAGSGDEAIRRYREHERSIDLVILDYQMPRMNGEECLRHLRAIDPSVRAVLSSGHTPPEVEQRLGELGLSGFLPKPYSTATISEAIKRALRSSN